jgi:transcriptional regulator with XRE-family HTH domain
MDTLGQRIRQRFDELGISQAEAARAANCSTARFGNYVTGTRNPDLETLARIAVALRTKTDWLLGVSDAAPVDIKVVLRHILELDGMQATRATVIAQAAEEALRLLASLPSGGDAQTRALLAAQAAWQLKSRQAPR